MVYMEDVCNPLEPTEHVHNLSSSKSYLYLLSILFFFSFAFSFVFGFGFVHIFFLYFVLFLVVFLVLFLILLLVFFVLLLFFFLVLFKPRCFLSSLLFFSFSSFVCFRPLEWCKTFSYFFFEVFIGIETIFENIHPVFLVVSSNGKIFHKSI